MGETAVQPQAPTALPAQRPRAALTGAVYVVLPVLGIVLAVVGGFQHAWYVGGLLPVAALLWVPVLFGVCYGAGRVMRGRLAAALPAVAWLVASMLLATPSRAGDLVIAGDPAGYVYLYGGAVAIVAAVLLAPSSGPSWLLTPRH